MMADSGRYNNNEAMSEPAQKKAKVAKTVIDSNDSNDIYWHDCYCDRNNDVMIKSDDGMHFTASSHHLKRVS